MTRDAGDLPRLPPGFVSRQRLIDRCDKLATADLLFVRALTGSGKTSLLADWAKHRSASEDVLWVSLDPSGDLAAPQLWDRIAGAADRLGLDGGGRGAASIAAALNRHSRAVRIVIDGLAVGNSTIEHELVRLATLLSRGGVVVATRDAHSPRSALLSVQARIATITSAIVPTMRSPHSGTSPSPAAPPSCGRSSSDISRCCSTTRPRSRPWSPTSLTTS